MMPEISSNTTLFQLLCEVRFDESLLFQDLPTLNGLQKRLKKDGFPQHQNNPDGSIAFMQPESRSVLLVNKQVVSLTMVQPRDLGGFNSKATKFIPDVLQSLDVDTCQRIGVRAQWMVNLESENDAIAVVRNSVMAPSIGEMFPTMTGPAVGFALELENNKFINVGIRAETHRILEIFNNVTKQNSTVSGVVVDLDIYDQTSNIQRDQINGFVKNLDTTFNSVLEKVLKCIGWR